MASAWVVMASSIKASIVANKMNFSLQSRRMFDTAFRIGSRKWCMRVPAKKIHSRISPQAMPMTARCRWFDQVASVTTVVIATSQKARIATKTDRPFLIRSTQA